MDEKFLEGLQQMIVDGVVEGTVEGITEELKKEIQGTPSSVNEKRFMNKKEVCEYLGISYATLKNWEDSGMKPSLINGTQYVYDKEEVVAFVKQHSLKE